ncbi:MAG: hypothetical protein SGARI_008094, partial [Bacillariaceae sp.]
MTVTITVEAPLNTEFCVLSLCFLSLFSLYVIDIFLNTEVCAFSLGFLAIISLYIIDQEYKRKEETIKKLFTSLSELSQHMKLLEDAIANKTIATNDSITEGTVIVGSEASITACTNERELGESFELLEIQSIAFQETPEDHGMYATARTTAASIAVVHTELCENDDEDSEYEYVEADDEDLETYECIDGI